MNPVRKGMIAVAMAGSMLVGGALFAGSSGSAASTSTTTPAASRNSGGTTVTPPANGGKFVSNDNATHEAGESAAREAQENAGQFPTVR